MKRVWGWTGRLAALLLGFAITPALAFPTHEQDTGNWAMATYFDSPEGKVMLLVDLGAVERSGDVVHGREALVYAKTQQRSSTGSGQAFDIAIQEGEFDCKAHAIRFRGGLLLNMHDFTGAVMNPPAGNFIPIQSNSTEFVALTVLCGAAPVSEIRYRSPTLAYPAFKLTMSMEGDARPPPPTPNAAWEMDAPPANGSWRVIDPLVGSVQMIETSSLMTKGGKTRFWLAAMAEQQSGDGLYLTEARVELDCATRESTFLTVRHLNAAGAVIAGPTAAPGKPAMNLGVLNLTNRAVAVAAACHPGRLNLMEAYDNPYLRKPAPPAGH